MQMIRCAALPLLLVLAAPALAQVSALKQDLDGRYALDKQSCAAKDYFATIKAGRIDLPTYSCEKTSFDQIESKGGVETYAVKSPRCQGEEGKAKADSFRILRKSGTIQVLWRDGTKSGVFIKC